MRFSGQLVLALTTQLKGHFGRIRLLHHPPRISCLNTQGPPAWTYCIYKEIIMRSCLNMFQPISIIWSVIWNMEFFLDIYWHASPPNNSGFHLPPQKITKKHVSCIYLQITSTVLSFPMNRFTPHQTNQPTLLLKCRGTQVGFNPAWHSNLRPGPGRGVFWEGPFSTPFLAANFFKEWYSF